uniref:C2H2-type domain-containing protein n=1 Tax=Macrostomum lignano TaxID=282301 RepID=A0A1I8FL56_9PLAT
LHTREKAIWSAKVLRQDIQCQQSSYYTPQACIQEKSHLSAKYAARDSVTAAISLGTHGLHTGEKPFECIKALKAAYRRKAMFECKVCGKRISVTAAVSLSTPGSTQEKSHLSAKCAARDSDKKSHLSAKCAARDSVTAAILPGTQGSTQEKPFECKVCGKKFNQLKAETGFEHRHLSTDCSPTVSQRCAGALSPARFVQAVLLPTRPAAAQYLRHVRSHTELAATRSLRRRLRPTQKLAERRRRSSRSRLAMSQRCSRVQMAVVHATLVKKKFSRRSYLNAHISVVHRKATPHKCKRCVGSPQRNPICTCTAGLTLAAQQEEKPFECKVWRHKQERSVTDSSALGHLRQHTGEKPQMRRGSVACPFCPRRFCRTRPQQRRSTCVMCGHTELAATRSLRRRLRPTQKLAERRAVEQVASRNGVSDEACVVHRKAKPHKCKRCGKSFSAKHDLHVHSRSHTVVRDRFECKEKSHLQCKVSAGFSVSSSLYYTPPGKHTGKSHMSAKCAQENSSSAASHWPSSACTQREKAI